jgi:hypothetical protein
LLVSLASAFVGVIWIELWKIGIRKKCSDENHSSQ